MLFFVKMIIFHKFVIILFYILLIVYPVVQNSYELSILYLILYSFLYSRAKIV